MEAWDDIVEGLLLNPSKERVVLIRHSPSEVSESFPLHNHTSTHRLADQPHDNRVFVRIDALADMKALEVKVLDVRGLTDVADFLLIASGTSDRHVRSVAQRVVERTKEAGFRPHGVEGQQDSDWVLIDLNEMIVHVMLPRVREFYGLEKLWDITATKRAARA